MSNEQGIGRLELNFLDFLRRGNKHRPTQVE